MLPEQQVLDRGEAAIELRRSQRGAASPVWTVPSRRRRAGAGPTNQRPLLLAMPTRYVGELGLGFRDRRLLERIGEVAEQLAFNQAMPRSWIKVFHPGVAAQLPVAVVAQGGDRLDEIENVLRRPT